MVGPFPTILTFPPVRKGSVRPVFEDRKDHRRNRVLEPRVLFHVRVSTAGKGLVLVVEDDHSIADVLRLYLSRAGYGVHVEHDGSRGLAQVAALRPALVLLDVGLPDLDGVEVCRRMRAQDDWTPVIFVTARDDEVDRVLGLELGADDYVTKPFSPRELVSRVTAVLRRSSGSVDTSSLELGPVRLEPGTREVTVGGRRVDLTATEFDLLAALMRRPGLVFTREQLLSTVWGAAAYGQSRTVDVHIAQLRAKLGAESPIRTHRGVGYSAVRP
jgi:DNA-binding response OmpR family regulator